MRWACVAVVLALGGGSLLAQLSPEEAQQRLEERQKQRQAEREKTITIQQGQLDDLQAELARLRAENVMLKQQLARATPPPPAPAPAAAAPPASKKKYTRVEIGMTREELLDFIAAHSDAYQVEGLSVHESGRHGGQTVITRQETTQQGDAPAQTTQRRTQIIESRTTPSKRELIRINLLEPQQVVVGRHKDALGHWVQDTGIEYRKAGWIWAHLEDNVVTSVDVHAH